jgi:chemotaxis response regulator CheB
MICYKTEQKSEAIYDRWYRRIGASAGGLESFSELIARVPDGTGKAYIVVQYLHPGHGSHLAIAESVPKPALTN